MTTPANTREMIAMKETTDQTTSKTGSKDKTGMKEVATDMKAEADRKEHMTPE